MSTPTKEKDIFCEDFDLSSALIKRELVKFRLHYSGPLPSSSKTPHHRQKMMIRRALHPQLVELWRTHHVLSHLTEKIDFTLGNWKFRPLVNRRLDLICKIDVLMLRRQEPGGIIKNTGDIDNQLSTLFDALRMPLVESELNGETPTDDEKPLFCLLEDDSLIVQESVDTDRLLEPLNTPSEVKLMMQVTVKATRLTGDNRLFVGYDTD